MVELQGVTAVAHTAGLESNCATPEASAVRRSARARAPALKDDFIDSSFLHYITGDDGGAEDHTDAPTTMLPTFKGWRSVPSTEQAEVPAWRPRPAQPTPAEARFLPAASVYIAEQQQAGAGSSSKPSSRQGSPAAAVANKHGFRAMYMATPAGLARRALLAVALTQLNQEMGQQLVEGLGLELLGARLQATWQLHEELLFCLGMHDNYRTFEHIRDRYLKHRTVHQLNGYYYNAWKTRSSPVAEAYLVLRDKGARQADKDAFCEELRRHLSAMWNEKMGVLPELAKPREAAPDPAAVQLDSSSGHAAALAFAAVAATAQMKAAPPPSKPSPNGPMAVAQHSRPTQQQQQVQGLSQPEQGPAAAGHAAAAAGSPATPDVSHGRRRNLQAGKVVRQVLCQVQPARLDTAPQPDQLPQSAAAIDCQQPKQQQQQQQQQQEEAVTPSPQPPRQPSGAAVPQEQECRLHQQQQQQDQQDQHRKQEMDASQTHSWPAVRLQPRPATATAAGSGSEAILGQGWEPSTQDPVLVLPALPTMPQPDTSNPAAIEAWLRDLPGCRSALQAYKQQVLLATRLAVQECEQQIKLMQQQRKQAVAEAHTLLQTLASNCEVVLKQRLQWQQQQQQQQPGVRGAAEQPQSALQPSRRQQQHDQQQQKQKQKRWQQTQHPPPLQQMSPPQLQLIQQQQQQKQKQCLHAQRPQLTPQLQHHIQPAKGARDAAHVVFHAAAPAPVCQQQGTTPRPAQLADAVELLLATHQSKRSQKRLRSSSCDADTAGL